MLMRRAMMGGIPPLTYATWNPADKSAYVTLSGGDLVAVNTAYGECHATLFKSTGIWFYETTLSGSSGGGGLRIGWGKTENNGNAPGDSVTSWGWDIASGYVFINGTPAANTNTYPVAGDVLGVWFNAANGHVMLKKNGVTVLADTNIAGAWGSASPLMGGSSAGYTTTTNFGASAWAYGPHTGANSGVYI